MERLQYEVGGGVLKEEEVTKPFFAGNRLSCELGRFVGNYI